MVCSHVCCQPRCATHVPCLNCRRNDHKADLLCSCSAHSCGVSRELSDTPCRRGGDETQRRRLCDSHSMRIPVWTKCTAGFGVLDTEQITTPLDSPMERKAWPPPSHHHRVITLPGSSLCLLQATRRWGAPGRYSGGEASTLPASTRNSLCFHAHVSHAPSHSIYGFDSHRRLSSRKGDMTAASRQPLPMMLQVQSPCTSAFPR